jgi:hypothetical protein
MSGTTETSLPTLRAQIIIRDVYGKHYKYLLPQHLIQEKGLK